MPFVTLSVIPRLCLKATGKVGKRYKAHHTIPQKFRKDIKDFGIDIDEPGNVVWRKTENHRSNNYNITQEWTDFFQVNHTKEEVLKFRDEMEKKYFGNLGDNPLN